MISLFYQIAFTTNADAANKLIFGKHIQTWLIYTLIFLGLSSIGFLSVWVKAFVRDRKTGQSFKQPWD